MKILDVFMTDFGPVTLGRYAKTLPRRKNGNFDMRFRVSKEFVMALKHAAKDAYMNSRTAILRRFGDRKPETLTNG